jgi:integrase/recombinase XerC
MSTGEPFLVTAAPDLAEAAGRWSAHLGAERRMAGRTVEAYRRDLSQLLAFLTGHLGAPPGLSDLSALRPADLRAFLAARRTGGAGARTARLPGVCSTHCSKTDDLRSRR